MSGGHFNYDQYKIGDIAQEIKKIVNFINSSNGYSTKTIRKFNEAIGVLHTAEIMAQRIDWLICGDDGENTFHERWDEELKVK